MKWDFLQLNSEKFQKKFKISFEKKQKKKSRLRLVKYSFQI